MPAEFLYQEKAALDLTAETCQPCHSDIYNAYVETAHFKTSCLPSEQTIKGSFQKKKNVVRTSNPNTSFTMEARKDGFYQVSRWMEGSRKRTRRERFDIVLGSGRKGQSYLFWKEGFLYQLPISYLASIDQWANSPGFIDGEVNLGRGIPPRCLECHSTHFELSGTPDKPLYREDYQLGITCAKCHGGGEQHVEYHASNPSATRAKFIINPRSFSRERQLDSCALCHSGIREPIRPSFSYRPGEVLSHYLLPEPESASLKLDVHASQIGMIKKSACFSSGTMTCSTCHNVHRSEKDLAWMSKKCQFCHQSGHCSLNETVGTRIGDYCVACHMPDQESQVLSVNRSVESISPAYRNHVIAIYRDTTEKVLRQLEKLRD